MLKLVFLAIQLLQAFPSTNSAYDNQPRIITSDGNLVFEPAVDKNITFRLKGRGYVNINDVNIVQLVGKNGNTTIQPGDAETLMAFQTQLQSLYQTVRGPAGLLQRVRFLENAGFDNTTGNGTRPRLRMFAINQRINAIQRKVGGMETKLRKDNCANNPCQHAGTCINQYESYVCLCPMNWEGPTCETDVNECAQLAGTDLGCQNGATCVNSPGDYSCQCAPGFFGMHCTQRTADCLGSSDLCGPGTCVHTNDPAGYKCICNQGWTTNGITPACTVDIDECTASKPHCSMDPPVQCINLPGAFMCGHCPPGFTGNGFYCADINECEINNGGCSTTPSVTCINTRGSFHCGNCPLGYTGDGRTCTQSGGLCSTPGICHPLATCVEYQNTVACVCPDGYSGGGMGPNGCVRSNNFLCQSNPCQNGGSCRQVNATSFECNCPVGTNPPLCATVVDPCLPNPCQNNATCTNTQNGRNYRCTCPPNFIGRNCQKAVQACGGVLKTESGTLKYPPDGSMYQHNSRCAWLLRTNMTKVLNVTFTKFNVELSSECRFDWLQIHDGRSSASHLIGRFCGTEFPKGGTIISTHNVLYFWFRSDNTTAHSGFEFTWDTIDPICGGVIETTSHGSISSPGAPGNYPPNRDCEWTIKAPPGKRIQFLFYMMQIEAHSSCLYDFLEVYSGDTKDTLLERFCNTTHPKPILTPSNEALLYFHSDGDSNDAGFQIAYSVVEGIPGCGGTFTQNSGEVKSPSQFVDGTYPHNLQCEYVIQLPAESRIMIKFLKFDLEHSDECYFDYLEVFDGPTDQEDLVGKYCGDTLPPKFTSTRNTLLIKFKSDFSTARLGFVISYEIACGGVFEEPTGVLMSPFYPNHYQADHNCEFNVVAPLKKAIVLHFIDLDFEESFAGDCSYDSITVYDGHDANATRLGKYCDAKPDDIISTYNYLHLTFQSDQSVHGRGFKANYSFIDIACGGIIKTQNTVISPPRDEEDDRIYASDTSCKWVVIAPPGNVVQITWLTFDLEASTDCQYDYVEIFDNSTTHGGKMGRFCGTALPPASTTTENVMTLTFKTDMSSAKLGFSALITFIEGSKDDNPNLVIDWTVYEIQNGSQPVCGGNYFTSTGVIRSPGFPDNYYESMDCEWIITAPTGQQIELRINTFELESHQSCRFDYLEIRNGGTNQAPLVGTYCGTKILKRIVSFGNKMYLKFTSDSSRNEKGFELEWDSTSTGCGGVMTSPRGSISSPNYPEPYGANAQCVWKISISEGSSLQMIFVDLDLEAQPSCVYDYVEIFDGRDPSTKKLGKFCTTELLQPLQLETTGNHAFVRLITDATHQLRGFNLRYNFNCNRTIENLHNGVIESPNFPENYPANLHCEWRIKATKGNKIQYEFSHFDLENLAKIEGTKHICQFDYVELIDLKDNVELSSTKYCNAMTEPIAKVTEGDEILIRFKSDPSGAETGFRMEWEVQGCGGTFIHPSGTFSSPNYPNPYPDNKQCQWTITADYGNVIELTFDNLDFEKSGECTYDGLQITDNNADGDVIGKYCQSTDKPTTIVSHSHQMFIKFYSDSSNAQRGFLARYRVLPAACGGTLTMGSGFIYSPQYPKNYGPNQVCEWRIQTDKSHTLNLGFMDFDLEGSQNCTHDSLAIYDGLNTNQLLRKECGNQVPEVATVSSKRNEMMVVFKTDSSVEAKGFKLNYTTSCGSNIVTNSSGEIQLSSTARPNSDDCSWTITADNPSKRVSLTITQLNLQRFSSDIFCDLKLEIYEGVDRNGSLKTSFCNNKLPPTIVSNGNSLFVGFSADMPYSLSHVYFAAHYSVFDNACGGIFDAEHGEFSSPGYPNSYPNNVECIWVISAAPGNKVSLSFQSVEIEDSENCNEDYLEIREMDGAGKWIDYMVIDVLCGSSPATANLTTASKLWIKFRSNEQGTAAGFLASYKYVENVELTGTSGQIASPMYPNYLLNSFDHTYRILVSVGNVISLDFKVFQMCHSRFEVYDGYDNTAPLAEGSPSCDTAQQEVLISSTNVVYLRVFTFMSNGQKFLLEWKEVGKPDQPKKPVNSTCGPTEIQVRNGTVPIVISSPGYPRGYDTNIDCKWIIESSNSSHHPMVTFTDIDLEAVDSCLSDYVEVLVSKDRTKWNLVEKLCTFSINRRFAFEGEPYLMLHFKSDYYQNRTGFSAMTYAICGGDMREPNGLIEVFDRLRMPQMNAHPQAVCIYNITVRSGKTVQFQFDSLAMPYKPGTTECNGYIIIKNGIDDDAPLLGAGRFCGTPNQMPTIPATTSNRAYVKYYPFFRDAFQLRYKEVGVDCGGRINLSEDDNATIINSPNYPNIPPPHIECTWTIVARNGERLRVDFIERFDLTNTPNCEKEYVELRDGGTSLSRIIGTYCHETLQTQYTRSNMLRVKYFTDVNNPKNGFKIRVSTTLCGGFYRSSRGVITSPHYPGQGAYPANKECEYRISGNMGSVINITFNDLDLPEAVNCSTTDHLAIYSVIPEMVSGQEVVYEIGKFCGSQLPNSVTTDSNEAIVKFKTFADGSGLKGFSILYESSRVKCGGSVESDSGVIMSNGYPGVALSKQYCEWKITVARGKRIKLTIDDLDFMETTNMYTQRIGFYNGHSYTNRIKFLRKLEGNATQTIYSSANKMLINFWVRTPSVNRGFKLSFTSEENAVCVGDLNAMEADIQSPKNASNFFCEFYRDNVPLSDQADKGTLAMYFNGVMGNTRVPANCRFFASGTTVSRQSVALETLSVIKRLCNSAVSVETVRSPFPDTKLEVKQSQYIVPTSTSINFTMHYKVHNCGGILRESSNNVQQPTFVDNYGKVECAWYVEMQPRYTMNFQITQLDLKQPCDNEYLLIYNGATPIAPLMGRICGGTIPAEDMRSSSNMMFIEYHSDTYDKTSKFQFQTVAAEHACGGVLTKWARTFGSPSIEGSTQYPSNAECVWEIQAEAGYHIGVTFKDRFFIEDSDNCTKDFLEVFDFKHNDWTSLGRVCGRKLPPAFNSTGPRMKVLFRSDEKNNGDGFTIEWEQNCGGIFDVTEERQTLASPGYPGNYGRMLHCNYTLVAPEGQYMWIKFLEFELETMSKQCNFDNLTVHKQEDYGTSMTKMGTYCKKDSLEKFRAKERVEMVLVTDAWVERRGFQFEYYLDVCGGLITNSTLITSPVRDSPIPSYQPQMTCYWNITAPEGKKIVVRFEKFDIEQGYDCYFDFVRVFSGREPDQKNRLASLCGRLTGHTPAISINNRHGLIHMQTDGSTNNKGFTALILFTEDCDKTIDLTTELSYDINAFLGSGYKNSLDCHYLVHTKPGDTLTVSFEQFQVACCENRNDSTDPRSCDYVEVRDGAGPFAEVMTRACGYNTPQAVTTSGNSLYFRFVTDAINTSTGFVAHVTVSRGQCGQPLHNLTDDHDIILPPPAPTTLNNFTSLRCSWQLIATPGKMIELEFVEFRLQNATNQKCEKEVLKIADENQRQYIAEGIGESYIYRGRSQIAANFYTGVRQPTAEYEYCGEGLPNPYISSGHRVHVTYTSNGAGNHMGFKLQTKVLSACSRTYTSLTGRIMSYEAVNCDVLISVPEGNTISIYFSSFGFYSCENDAGFKIYDGGRGGSLLFTACGYNTPNPVFSTTNQLHLKSVTSRSDAYASIDITYVANNKTKGCGGQLFNYGGVFTSPMYPNTERSDMDCRWEVAVPQNMQVALIFNVFDMGAKITCPSDYIEIIHTTADGVKHTLEYCGDDTPEKFRGSTNVVTVHYKKSVHFSGTGWIIHFIAVHPDSKLADF